jgi:threonyl-tRNA synthetase
MRILSIHSDFIEFEPLTKAIKNAEDAKREKKRIEECLVVFTSSEEGDTKEVVESAKQEIMNIAKQVKASRIVIYPFVHLSSSPAKPDVALELLKEMEKLPGYDVTRAPFGWYKSFTVKCKGHPLSELSRTFQASAGTKEKEVVSDSLKKEAVLTSKFYIMKPDGEMIDVQLFDFTGHDNLKKFADYEMKKVRVYQHEPPHIAIMKSHSIVNYEPASDPGHFRWLPKGLVIKKTLERMCLDWCKELGAMEVETPIMYDMKHPTLEKYLHRFPARQYTIQSEDKELFLRFAACFGQFLAMHDMIISYQHLPMKMVEMTKYSFRREQSGELAGLKRLRAFTMADMHTLCSNIATAKKEFEKQFEKSLEWNRILDLNIETAFRAQTEFFEEHKDWYVRMAGKSGKPMLLELFDVRYAYFITKFEFNYVDTMDKASALSTVQIDVENSETYDINYVDKDGKKKHPIILHASLSGSFDRVVYALLEDAAAKIQRKEVPSFPLFLSPTQVRLVPFSAASKEHMKYVKSLSKKLLKANIRVDIDDRNESIGKRIRDAEMDWIPYIVVIGDREIKEGKLAVRERGNKENRSMDPKELVKEIKSKIKSYPFEKLSLPMYLTERPVM